MELVLNAVSVRRSPQDEHLSYLGSLFFGDIARLIDDNRLYVPNQPDLPDFAQRKLNKARVKQIALYILENYQIGTIFFPPICVNVQPKPKYEEGKLFLPYYSVSLRLTDGQHRCFGIHQALQEIQQKDSIEFKILSQLEIGVLLYAGLPLEEERQAFRDQNLLVQRPSVSLSHYFDKRSLAVLIAKNLLETVPQFIDNIEVVETGLGIHNPKLMTLSTLVTATKYMFPNLKSQKKLEDKNNWARSFWITSANIFDDNPWRVMSKEERSQQRQETLLVSAVILQALGMLAHDLYQENVAAEDLEKWLNNLKKIDWRRNDKFWLQRGVTQIGATEDPIISNTKTTVKACHKVLREFMGITEVIF
ncbi:DNA sulfur modification protein DndB [Crocosphaera sp. UHCC 0190]|uniref:DNA sulfur modification protein DndB n=1 Tax=unclassified Crocosphaera TaxID=2623705 RepID=UPI002B219E66|nr:MULTISPECIES: DNA sulfur modification protein DndB [unclassified Crocosphaera]MEA5511950.1 DNA sulfur modification protein DndB [Crocosphaera sp. UHCC 0190]MEA5536682.1 DNA sulfur modification protein DndB [Crocosphaera sp. XPORK-15E]